jgi:dolichol-phosphate mannosyltransferase
MKIDFSIIVPAFNEEETIENFMINLKEGMLRIEDNYEIIVIDDGSTDNTSSIASHVSAVNVIRHPNKGNGVEKVI